VLLEVSWQSSSLAISPDWFIRSSVLRAVCSSMTHHTYKQSLSLDDLILLLAF